MIFFTRHLIFVVLSKEMDLERLETVPCSSSDACVKVVCFVCQQRVMF